MISINIDIFELNKIMSSKTINLIDIRMPYKYLEGTIKNAINIPEDKLLYNAYLYLNRNEVYYIFCDNGTRSRKLTAILNSCGYNVYNINGGYNKYILEKYNKK